MSDESTSSAPTNEGLSLSAPSGPMSTEALFNMLSDKADAEAGVTQESDAEELQTEESEEKTVVTAKSEDEPEVKAKDKSEADDKEPSTAEDETKTAKTFKFKVGPRGKEVELPEDAKISI